MIATWMSAVDSFSCFVWFYAAMGVYGFVVAWCAKRLRMAFVDDPFGVVFLLAVGCLFWPIAVPMVILDEIK